MSQNTRSVLFNITFLAYTFICCVLYLPSLLLPRLLYIKVLRLYFYGLYWLEKHIIGLDFTVRGRENLPEDGAYIIAAKHYSTYETMKLPILFDDFSVILKRELMWIPLWGWYAAKFGVVPIDRGRSDKALAKMNQAARKMQQAGRPIVIFPQGTRVALDHSAKDRPYKKGAAHMALALDLPIVPLSMNSGVFWPRHSSHKKAGTVVFEFGAPIQPPASSKGNSREMMKQVEQVIETTSQNLVGEAT